jgi:hypothetical protein
MAFQVLVKTTAVMQGAYTFLLGSREERDEFVRRPDVWWYHYPEEDDDWRWHRGGAWKPAHQMTSGELARDLEVKPLPPKGFMPGAVTVEEEDGDDDRWLPGRLVRPLPPHDLALRRAVAARQRRRLDGRPVPQRVRLRQEPG